ncbi:MAG TPA: glycosyltransferase family 4 protein [Thermoanaerobaculia bacterium]|nr:glycosyltransferase family 4 protein [Thermoanaerobaculia bacterium]
MPLRVLHLAAGNRWTGAAAPAFAEVEALRGIGIDAHYAYVGGYKLQQKIGHYDFAHPLIEKAQNPLSFVRTLDALGRMIARHGFDIIHAHLTYDHWLARVVARQLDVRRIARTFHARRVLRSDPFTRSLLGRTEILCAVNDTFANARVLQNRAVVFTPPPVDHRQFHPDGENVRGTYKIAPHVKVITVIGKLSKHRGFEEALETFAILHKRIPQSLLMIIGHGEHRPALQTRARELAIDRDVLWAGYHETDLAEHYRASDVLLFTARGSDEGHRAILEAMACGVPVASLPLDGVRALAGSLPLIADNLTPQALAERALAILKSDLRKAVTQRSREFGYEQAAQRLLEAYGE